MWTTSQIDGVGQEFVALDQVFQFGSVRVRCGVGQDNGRGEERSFTAQKSRGWLEKVGRKKVGVALEEGLKGFYRVKPSWDVISNLSRF